MQNTQKHPLALLHLSEVVTIGLLRALRGEGCRAFDRWLRKELSGLFPRLPERTRLFRLLQAQVAGSSRTNSSILSSPDLLWCV